MTLKQLTDQIGNTIRDTSATTDTRIREQAQQCLDIMLMRMGPSVLEREGQIRTTSGRSTYALRPDVAKVLPPMRSIENQEFITPIGVNQLDKWRPKQTAAANPQHYYIWGTSGVERQPESKVHLISNSTSDTQKVTVYGVSGGRATSEAVTLTGSVTTGVLTSNTYSELTDEPVAASAAVGTITGTMNSTTGDSTLPTTTTAGNVTVFTIAVGATTTTTMLQPGSYVRIKMNAWDAGDTTSDLSKSVTVRGYGVIDIGESSSYEAANDRDRVWLEETITTDGSDGETEVQSSNLFTEIVDVSKNWDSFNTLLVMTDPGALIVAAMPPAQRSLRFPQLTFYPQPSGETIRYRYIAQTPILGTGSSSDSYQPPWDRRFDNIWLTFTEKLIRAYKANKHFDLRENQGFVAAMSDADASDVRTTQIKLGSNWQQTLDAPVDFPITVSS